MTNGAQLPSSASHMSDASEAGMKHSTRQSIRKVMLRGTAGAAFVTMLAAGLAFLLDVMLARVLGKQHYGIYVYATTIAGLLMLMARMGQDMALIRFVPGYVENENWGPLRGLLRFTQLSVVTLGTIIFVAVVGVVMLMNFDNGKELQWTLLISAMAIPIAALGSVYQFANRAFKRVVLALLPSYVLTPFLVIAFVLAAGPLAGGTLVAHHAAVANVLALLISMLVVMKLYHHARPAPLKAAMSQFRIREWLGVAMTMFLIAGTQQITSLTDTVMLGSMMGTDSAGLYNAANRVAILASFPLFITNTIGAPMISELYASGKTEDLQYLLRSIVRLTAIATLVIALGVIALGDWILSLFGGDFTSSYSALLVLVMGQMMNTLSGASMHVLMLTGHHRAAAVIMASAALANVLLNFILIPQFGMLGAALATAFSLAGWNVGMVIYARRRLGLDPSILAVLKPA